MAAWVIRGGRYAEREDEALENGFLTISFGIIKSLDNVQTPDEVAGCLDLSGNETNQQLASRVSQVWAFKDGIKNGRHCGNASEGTVSPRSGKDNRRIHVPSGTSGVQPCPSRGVDQPRGALQSAAREAARFHERPQDHIPTEPGRRRRTIAGGCQRRPGRSHKDAGASGGDTS